MGLRALNNPKSSFEDPYSSTGKGAGPGYLGDPISISATGGSAVIYTVSGKTYKAHTFLSSGTFAVSNRAQGAGLSNQVEYMVIGGGGGVMEGNGGGGAGGAGAVNIGSSEEE